MTFLAQVLAVRQQGVLLTFDESSLFSLESLVLAFADFIEGLSEVSQDVLFRDRLKELRDKSKLTQEALAQRAGTSVGNVRNYEQGIRLPSFPGVVKLARALGVECTAFSECEDVAESAEEEPKKSPTRKRGK